MHALSRTAAITLMTAGTWLAATSSSGGALAAEDTVLFGVSVSLTGSYARTGEDYLQGYKVWRDHVNARGGLLGRKVEFKVYDDQSDPTVGTKLVERLITQDEVDFVLAPFSSPITLPASTVTEKYQYPIIAAGASAQKIWQRGYKYIFQLYPRPESNFFGLLELAKEHGIETVAVVTEDTIFAEELAQTLVRMAKDRGLDVVFYEEYGKGATDLSPLVLKVRSKNPDLFFGATYLSESMLITRQSKELGLNPKIMAFSIGPALDDFVDTLGKDAEYIAGSTLWEPSLKLPKVDEFVSKYREDYDETPPYQTAAAYAGGQILEAAINEVGSFDHGKIRDVLASMEMTTIWGDYKVNEKGEQVAKRAYLIQIRDGKRRIVWPESVAEVEFVAPKPTW